MVATRARAAASRDRGLPRGVRLVLCSDLRWGLMAPCLSSLPESSTYYFHEPKPTVLHDQRESAYLKEAMKAHAGKAVVGSHDTAARDNLRDA